MLRILNAEPRGYDPEAHAALAELGEVVSEAVPQADLATRVRDFDALIVRLGLRVTGDIIRQAPRLRYIVTATTGLDHIDEKACSERGITVVSLSGEYNFLRTVPATAEHTWALLLALARNVPGAFEHVRAGGWERDRFRGTELFGKRLGILGLGRVGEKVAKYGAAFGMPLCAFDPHRRRRWPSQVSSSPSMEALMRDTDVLSIHVPLNEETWGLVGRNLLQALPEGSLIVNTSRGAIVDEAAAVVALTAGKLAGMATDVLAEEEPEASRLHSPLLRYAMDNPDANVIITPHLGGATHESMARTERFVVAKLRALVDTNGTE